MSFHFWSFICTANYKDSLIDAKAAIDLQPCYVNAIVRGEISVTLAHIGPYNLSPNTAQK